MVDPWNFTGPAAPLSSATGVVTLVDESTFAISGGGGDIVPGGAQGLFFRDTRLLSRLEVLVNGSTTETLTTVSDDPFTATFVSRGRPAPGQADSTLVVFRSRSVGRGMLEELTVRNFADEATTCTLEVLVGSDFADLFAVKEGRAGAGPQTGDVSSSVTEDGDTRRAIVYAFRRGGVSRAVEIALSDTTKVSPDLATYHVVVPARGQWTTSLEIMPVIDDTPVPSRLRRGEAALRSTPTERLKQWRRRVPQVETDHPGLKEVVDRSAEDLGALRIFDPEYPERVVVAAGAPWFMTVFGRDSLITAWMALLVSPDLARGVLQTLARFQGTEVDPRNDEEPGRILHEMRFGDSAELSLGGGSIYYGSADATPLFVMLLGEMRRWGVDRELVDELLPNAVRAIEWIDQFGDADGDGYVEYHRATDRGLANQGWKDSWDGIRYADGRVAEAPIALCEVQAYTYGAYLAR
ncbi:MAG TPA: glycogen debranching N-terminal domain-containing protein, partial [Acidimicrobiales bacterium]|nr:glycogen debranching N-terminal domain-containing protein [Acidimicrobiales bacterium]